MSEALDTLSDAAINNVPSQERNEQPPQPKRRKHKHALRQHKHAASATAAAAVSPAVAAPPASIVSALARGRSRSPPACSAVSSPRASTSTSTSVSVDTRAFQEILNDILHKHGEKNSGKMISDERFRRLLTACGLPKNDPQVARSEREAIDAHKMVAGMDGRLFAWKPGHLMAG